MRINSWKATPNTGMCVNYAQRHYIYVGNTESGNAILHPIGGTQQVEAPVGQVNLLSSAQVPVELFKDIQEYPVHLVAIAKERKAVIDAAFECIVDKEAVQRVANKLNVSARTAQRIIERYLFSGRRLTALIPRVFSFGNLNRKLKPEQVKVMKEVIKEKFLNNQKPSFESVVEAVNLVCRNTKIKEIGRTTILRELHRLDPGLVASERLGKKAFREAYKAHRGKAPIGDRPLNLVEIDHTQVDVFVILPSGKMYRPWITVAIDTYSRMILGFYLTMEPPSRLSVGLCLYCAMTPKTEWLRQHGLTANWPCYGPMENLVADNAKEFRGYFLEDVGLEHNITITFRPICQPNWGAHIERLMGRVADEMHLLPGTSFANPVERGDYDPTLHATLTLEELERFFLHYFVEVYHCSPHAGLNGRTPLSRWNDYFDRSGPDHAAILPQIQAGSDLMISLLPSVRRTIQQDGVEWETLRYNDPVLAGFIRRPNPNWSDNLWRFHFDPRDIRCLFWRDPATRQVYPIPLVGVSAHGITLWELEDFRAKDRAEAAATHDQATVDRGRNAMNELVQASQPLPLKTHRNRRKKAKEATLANAAPAPARTPSAPPTSLILPMAGRPVEDPDPSIWDDLQVLEVEPLSDPFAARILGEPNGR